jgi:hypothetical protein
MSATSCIVGFAVLFPAIAQWWVRHANIRSPL